MEKKIQIKPPYKAIISDASVFGGRGAANRSWGFILLTNEDLIFVTKSQFRSIGIYGAAGAPVLGLVVGVIRGITESIRSKITGRKLNGELPSPLELKERDDTLYVPYNEVKSITLTPEGNCGAVELVFGDVELHLNIPRIVRRDLKKRGLTKRMMKEEYAKSVAVTLADCAGINAVLAPYSGRHYRWLIAITAIAIPLLMLYLLSKFK